MSTLGQPEDGIVVTCPCQFRSGTCLAMFAFITAWFAYGSKLGYHLMPAIAMGVAGLGIVAMTLVMPSPQNETIAL